jgi:hypothetical protein
MRIEGRAPSAADGDAGAVLKNDLAAAHFPHAIELDDG